MNKLIDLMGKRFGCLVVVARSPRRTITRCSHWICECDCGNKVVVRSDNLREGRSTRCSDCRGKSGRQSVFYRGGEEDGECTEV